MMPAPDSNSIDCRTAERLIVDVLFGDPSPAVQAALREHLASCPSCATVYAESAAVLAATSEPVRPEPPPGFWEGFVDATLARLHEPVREPEPPRGLLAYLEALLVRLRPARTWAPQLTLTALLVAAGLYVGHQIGSPHAPPTETTVSPPTPATATADLDDRTERYIDRSKVLLLGISNAEPAQQAALTKALPRKQEIARELVREAPGLKAELDAAHEDHLSSLVDDMAFLLLQIANLDPEESASTFELVQRGVDQKAILLQIILAEMHWQDGVASTDDPPLLRQ